MRDRRYLCEPCDHKKWWQHRNPDPAMRTVGLVMIAIGVAEIIIGLAILWGQGALLR